MAFSENELQQIERSINRICNRIPEHVRDQLWNEHTISGHSIVLDEVRPRWDNPEQQTRLPFAKFTFVRTQSEWKLFWMRASGKWQAYEPFPDSTDLDELVNVVLSDELSCFFG